MRPGNPNASRGVLHKQVSIRGIRHDNVKVQRILLVRLLLSQFTSLSDMRESRQGGFRTLPKTNRGEAQSQFEACDEGTVPRPPNMTDAEMHEQSIDLLRRKRYLVPVQRPYS
jgi:hypothetical protein